MHVIRNGTEWKQLEHARGSNRKQRKRGLEENKLQRYMTITFLFSLSLSPFLLLSSLIQTVL